MRTIVATLAALAILGGCGQDAPEDYSQQTRDNFLIACTAPLEDSRLDVQICQCVFDKAQVRMPYERFASFDQSLIDNPEAVVPAELVDLIAECVVEEAEL
mgnify:CR=1 FL=1